MSRTWAVLVDGQYRIKVFEQEVDKMTVVAYYSHRHTSVKKIRPVLSGDYTIDDTIYSIEETL